jgi:flagellar hook-length control protein FliK
MNNLPICNNTPQTQTIGTPADVPQLRNDSSVASADVPPSSQANRPTNDQSAEAFSVLLARQLSDVALANAIPISTAVSGKTTDSKEYPTSKDNQGQVISDSTDQSNSLAVLLLQIPGQQAVTSPNTNPMVDTLLPHSISSLAVAQARLSIQAGWPTDMKQNRDEGMQIATDTAFASSALQSKGTGEMARKMDGSQAQTVGIAMKASNALPTMENPQHTELSTHASTIPLEVTKQTGVAISSLSQIQNSENNTKPVTSGTLVVTPNILAGNAQGATSPTISAPIGNNRWAEEFSQKIVWMNNQQSQTAELHLNPPDLGPLNVMLKFSDNQLTAQFTSPHSAVRDAVENAIPKLREILADNNITLGNATVSDQAPRDRGTEGFFNQGTNTSVQHEAFINKADNNILTTPTTQSMPTRRHNGILDIFA